MLNFALERKETYYLKLKSMKQQTPMSLLKKANTSLRRHKSLATPRLISLMLCLSLLLLGACRKSPKTPAHIATEGNLRIQLNCQGVDLRVGDDDPISAIEKLDLYFFSSESETAERTMVAHRTFGKDELTINAPLSMSLPVASYYLVAVLNATPAIQSTFGQGASWSKLSEKVYKFNELYSESQNKVASVVWSNDQGPIQIEKSAFDKGASPVQVPLAQTMARLRMFGEPKVPQYMSIDLTNGGAFLLGCVAKRSFLMRELAPLIGDPGNVMEKPGDGSSFANRYAYSYGYKEIASSNSSAYKTLLNTYRIDEISKTIFNLEPLKLIPKTVDECNLTDYRYYALETTIDPDHLSYYFIPSVLVGYKVYPTNLNALSDFKSDEGWISYNGRYYRGRDFTTYLKAIHKRNKATNGSSPRVSIPADYPKDLQDVCEEFVRTYGDKMQIPKDPYRDEIYPIDFKGLRYYLRSYNYYYLPIQHAPDQKGYGHYGIVRNNDYRIEIKSISDFGSPILMQIADHPEVYTPKQAISSTLTLSPLTDRNNTADL